MDVMQIQCIFDDFEFPHGERYHRCRIVQQNIVENKKLCIRGAVNLKVTHVKFEDCKLTRIPQGLTNIFPNMRSLSIQKCGMKQIQKCDLVEYRKLEKFICFWNEVEYLPEDLFAGFENLSWIGFFENKLKVIEPGLLDGLTKLNYIDFLDNPNYDMRFSVYPEYHSTHSSVAAISEELLEIKYRHPDHINCCSIKENSKLEIKIEELKAEIQQLNSQRGLFNDLTSFIQDENTKDFKIQIDDREFPVHKFLLAARSPTLAEILKNNPEVENLNLVDISVEIFEIILKFLYTDELPDVHGLNFLHLFAAAGKLKIVKLKSFAAEKVIDEIDCENVFDVLKIAAKYDHNKMKHEAFDFIKEIYPEIDFKDEWMKDHSKLSKVIEAYEKKKEAMQKIEEEFKRVVMTD